MSAPVDTLARTWSTRPEAEAAARRVWGGSGRTDIALFLVRMRLGRYAVRTAPAWTHMRASLKPGDVPLGYWRPRVAKSTYTPIDDSVDGGMNYQRRARGAFRSGGGSSPPVVDAKLPVLLYRPRLGGRHARFGSILVARVWHFLNDRESATLDEIVTACLPNHPEDRRGAIAIANGVLKALMHAGKVVRIGLGRYARVPVGSES